MALTRLLPSRKSLTGGTASSLARASPRVRCLPEAGPASMAHVEWPIYVALRRGDAGGGAPVLKPERLR